MRELGGGILIPLLIVWLGEKWFKARGGDGEQ